MGIAGAAAAAEPYPYRGDRVLLFPYQAIEGTAAKEGLWQDAHEEPVTRANPVVFAKRNAKVTLLKRLSVSYGNASLEVSRVSVKSDTFTMLDGRPVQFKELEGFVLSTRLR
ncbi:MAG TPA: hypothetical protein VGB20_07280 [bacterium]